MPITTIAATKSLGHIADIDGVCYGIAHMAAQAARRGELDKFKQRMDFIKSYNTPKAFRADVLKAENHRKAIHLYNKVHDDKKSLTQQEEMLCSIRPFFEGIELYHHAYIYQHLFQAKERPNTQNAEAASRLLMDNKDELKPSAKLCVGFDKKGLTQQLSEFKTNLDAAGEGTALTLTCSNHSITVVREENKWKIINHDEYLETNSDEECAQQIIDAMQSSNNITLFSMEIYLPFDAKEKSVNYVSNLKENEVSHIKKTINLQDSDQTGYMYLATIHGRDDLVQILLEQGSSPNQAKSDGSTPLHAAVLINDEKVMKTLLNSEKEKLNINAASKDSVTPLYLAVELGYHDRVQQLLEGGANPNIPIELDQYIKWRHEDSAEIGDGTTPLILAVAQGRTATVDILLKYNADINQADEHDVTPLLKSIKYNNHDMRDFLLEKGASPNKPDNGWNAVFHAVEKGDIELVKILASYGADFNQLYEDDEDYESTLYIAMKEGNIETLSLLIELGANPLLKDDNGVYPLLMAVSENNQECIDKMLCKYDVDKQKELVSQAKVDLSKMQDDSEDEIDDMSVDVDSPEFDQFIDSLIDGMDIEDSSLDNQTHKFKEAIQQQKTEKRLDVDIEYQEPILSNLTNR